MHANVSQEGILFFLLAGLCAAAAVGVMTLALVFGKADIAKVVARVSIAGAALYVIALLVASVIGTGRTLAIGEEKHFCEIDCHLAYAVTRVDTAARLGAPAAPVAAHGRFYLVTLRVRFDERTTSLNRGDGPLWPNPRWVELRDAAGRRYLESPEGLAAWEAAHGTVAGLDRPLRPGQSYLTTLVFDLPVDVRSPRLLVTDPQPFSLFIVSHENSPFHGKTSFALTT